MSAEPTAEEEPPYDDESAYGAAGTGAWAAAASRERALWIVGGAVLILGSVALFLVVRDWSSDLATGVRYGVGLAMRGAMFLMLLGGTYCVVRGSWRE